MGDLNILPKSYNEQLVKELYQILQLTSFNFSDEETKEVIDYIEHREHGIAIQTLGDILISKNLPVSEQAASLIDNLCEKMGMKNSNDEDGDHWFWLKMDKYFKSKP